MKTIATVAAMSALLATSPAFPYDLAVSSGTKDKMISGSRSYAIPKGTASVALVYNVYSAEYPYYVSTQSMYNDVWSLILTGADGFVYDVTRQVNSQLTQEPGWQPDSTTGDIRQIIDTSTLTANAQATIQVIATSMNVGDNAYSTIVSASIEPPPKLTITEAKEDSVASHNDGSYYSIPPVSGKNVLHRYFTLQIAKDGGITLDTISVTVRGASDLMQTMQQLPIPSASDVEALSQSATKASVRVRVTIRDPASAVEGNPPPTRDLAYRFEVTGHDADGAAQNARRTVTGKRALWRMASVLPGRYGTRDQGQDDWGARGTYTWLQEHASLINPVDDISGEHGRDIGHNTHAQGTDIDTYHFYRFAGAGSGTDNYNRLRANTLAAFGTLLPDGTPNPNPPAVATTAANAVAAWVDATRTGLGNLAQLDSVSHMYSAVGTAGDGLPNGWAQSLITTGTVKKTGTTHPLDLGLGAWSNAKVTYNSVHNNHVHITLNRTAIGD